MPSNLPVPAQIVSVDLSIDSASPSSPRRKIFTAADLEPWFASRAYADLEAYTLELCHSVVGKKVDDECFESEPERAIVSFLQEAKGWIDDIPLQVTPQRFGNRAFRDWLQRVKDRNDDFQKSLLARSPARSAPDDQVLSELSFNFVASFGSGPRLDYGTGHELSFVLWLLSLRLVGILSARDDAAVVLRIFTSYLELVRELQKVFKLEPAGSKGVWGLDDHQHLSYLFGASQLVDHPALRPGHILQPRILAPLEAAYLLPASILHIHALKTGPFSEHSPLLHQIASTVPNWAKVQNGLWKMYREEVLAKVPVVQHLRFGKTIRWIHRDSQEALPSTGDGREEGDRDDDVEQEEESATLKAPWASGSGTSASSVLNSNPSISTSAAPLSHAAARRTPYTVSSAASASKPTRFSPPTLFPPRLSTTSIQDASAVTTAPRRTVAEDGGAAAQSSPFGILHSATGPSPVSATAPTTRQAGADYQGTRAPWA